MGISMIRKIACDTSDTRNKDLALYLERMRKALALDTYKKASVVIDAEEVLIKFDSYA